MFPAAVVLALAVSGSAGCTWFDRSSEKANVPQGEATSTPSESPTTPADSGTGTSTAGFGHAVSSGQWELVALSFDVTSTAGGVRPGAGEELRVLVFDLTNNSPQGEQIGPSDFDLTDATGAHYQASATAGERFIFDTPQPIEAGETRTIAIVYALPKGSKGYSLTFAPFGSPSPATVPLD